MEEKKKLRKQNFIFMGGFAYLFVLFFALHMGVVPQSSGQDMMVTLDATLTHIMEKPLIFMPFTKNTFVYAGFLTIIYIILLLYFWVMSSRRDFDKDASGSAKWNTDMKAYNKKYNTPFGKKETNGYDNMILAKNLYLSMNGSKTRRNCHQVVFGGSGAGKSYSLVKPNGLQMNASYIFTDPKGELLEELAHPLEENGYEIKVFNISEMSKSLTYNPYAYIRDENGVRTMVNCIIDNTRGTDSNLGDPIWEDSMRALLQAISFYMIEKMPEKDRNFTNVMKLLRLAEVDEQNANSKSPFDLLFEALEKENPESMAVMSYKTFRIGSGKTLKSILITCMTRLDVFNMKAVAALTGTDTIHLEEIGRKRQALFIIIPAADKTFNFLAATLYTQLFETLYYQVENVNPTSYFLQKDNDTYLWGKDEAELKEKVKLIPESKIIFNEATNRFDVYDKDSTILIDSFVTNKSAQWFQKHAIGCKIKRGKRTLPYDVRFILDEFANIGSIPGFVEKLSTMRSYKIWCMIILQNIDQLKKQYKDDFGTIIGNCDTFIFLGSQEKDMIEYIEGFLSKTTKRQQSKSLSGKGGGSESYQTTSASLMAFNEIREMGDNDCIIFLRGEKPFKAVKYDYHSHPMWKYTGDANDENKYIIPYNNQKFIDKEKSNKDFEESKSKRYEAEIAKGETKVISMPMNTTEVFKKLCEGDISKIQERFEVQAEEETVATTKEEKKEAEKNYERTEEEKEDIIEEQSHQAEVMDMDIWDIDSL